MKRVCVTFFVWNIAFVLNCNKKWLKKEKLSHIYYMHIQFLILFIYLDQTVSSQANYCYFEIFC